MGDPRDTTPAVNIPGDGCMSLSGQPSWAPRDCGTFLARVTKWQKLHDQPFYNVRPSRLLPPPPASLTASLRLKPQEAARAAACAHARLWLRPVPRPLRDSVYATTWQEFIIDASDWTASLPQGIEAIFNAPEACRFGARTPVRQMNARPATHMHPGPVSGQVWRAFVQEYRLHPAEYPLLSFNARNWREPFSQVLPRAAPRSSRLPFGGAG